MSAPTVSLRVARRESGRRGFVDISACCRSGWFQILAVFVVLWLCSSTGQAQSLVLTNAGQIRALGNAQAAASLSVHLDCVVTYHEPGFAITYVQDETGGMFVRLPTNLIAQLPLKSGDAVRIVGHTAAGMFMPCVSISPVAGDSVRVTGRRPLPPSRFVPATELGEPSLNALWVETRAVPRKLSRDGDRALLEMEQDSVRFLAVLPAMTRPDLLPWQMIDSPVQLRGVAGPRFNPQGQLIGRVIYIPGVEDISLENGVGEAAMETLPLRDINSLLQFTSEEGRRKTRIQGVVTLAIPGEGFYLEDASGSLYVRAAQPVTNLPGDFVEVVGIPTPAPLRPEMRGASYRVIEHRSPPAPVAPGIDIIKGLHHDSLVTIEGELLQGVRAANNYVLLLQYQGIVFQATLQLDAASEALTHLKPGTGLRVTGVCQMRREEDAASVSSAQHFNLLTRGAEDVELLPPPPWWTLRRLAWSLCGVTVLALGVLVWGVQLRRRVEAQTEVIQRTLERQTLHQERTRIARELHDTVEQQLAGIAMQLELAGRHVQGSAASRPLELARQMLNQSREESRYAIRALRSPALLEHSLPAALEDLIRPLVQDSGIRLQLSAPVALRLPALVESHLLRIAHEAVGNCVQHAHAKNITVEIQERSEGVLLLVRDDGCGFDFDEIRRTKPGHFGLLGMCERAEKMNGKFTLRSRPGQGTEISIHVPSATFQAQNGRSD